jgi:arylsulfatase A-like enzyme
MHDNVLRLDRNLGAFLDSLFRMRDSSRIAIVLTADHGIGSVPELAPKSALPRPVRVNLPALVSGLSDIAALANIDTMLIELDQHIVVVDPKLAATRRAGLDSVLDIFATQVRQLPGVARVDRFRDLVRGDTVNDPIARRWVHQLPAGGNAEMVITLTPYSIFSGIFATHGSPYDYDSWVPLIFWGPWFTPGHYTERVRTVDLAPTLAAVAGVKPVEKIDGVALTRAIKKN